MPDFSKRRCFYIDPTQKPPPEGYVPSLVFEDDPGHCPMLGNGPHAVPWYWGKTLEEAEATCSQVNTKDGLSDRDVVEIICSSMRAQNTRRTER